MEKRYVYITCLQEDGIIYTVEHHWSQAQFSVNAGFLEEEDKVFAYSWDAPIDLEKTFNIAIHIDGYNSDEQIEAEENVGEILRIVTVLQKPSMFKNIPWYITNEDTGEILASNDMFEPCGYPYGRYWLSPTLSEH